MKLRFGHLFAATLLAGTTTACGDDGGTPPSSDAGTINANNPSKADAGKDAASPTSQANTTSIDAGQPTATEGNRASSEGATEGEPTEGVASSYVAPASSAWVHPTGGEDWVSSTAGDNGSGPGEVPDLSILSASLGASGFTTVEVDEESCEIQDGCYSGGGTRTVIPFELTITNSGNAPLNIGAPWDSSAFHLSACTLQYRASNFIKAEVLNQAGDVVAVRHLPTSCIADEGSATYTCSIQGLDVGDSSAQPNTCSGLDVTGLAAGAYSVRFTVNASRQFYEDDVSNNTIEVALEKPECDERFCGGVCCPEMAQCVDNMCLLPDLRANQDAVERSLIIKKQVFDGNSCELEEMCITGPGKRRLLQFEGRIENVGSGALNPGPEQNNPLFEHSACHDHYHFLDFTDYKLLSADGSVAVQGHKQSFCLVSMDRVEDYVGPVVGEVVHPEPGETGCSYLEAGWADIYGVGTPCQWVDVTDVAPGDYMLQVAVNPAGKIAEGNVENNVIQVPVHIPADAPCQDEEVCGDVVDQDCDGFADPADADCQSSEFCCGDTDNCGLAHNWQCDCEGQPAWEQHDCEAPPDEGGECCTADDSCGWANDGLCDCGGAFEWDEQDCNRIEPWCCQMSSYWGYDYCGISNNGVCDCGEGTFWEADCGGGGDGGVVTAPPDCCTSGNLCNWAGDGFCDCDGEFAWDTQDCAGSADGGSVTTPAPTSGPVVTSSSSGSL